MSEHDDPTTTSDLLMRLKGEIEGLKLWMHVLIATHPNVGVARSLVEQMQSEMAIPGEVGAGFVETVQTLMATAERASGAE